MEDGFLTLLFILLMVAAAIMDAVGRRRAKQRRMEEMEEEEEEARERPMLSTPDRGEPARTEAGQRETAETMVPEDFWAILTGQEPERRPPPEPEPEMGRRGDPDPPKEPRIPSPVPDDRYSVDDAGDGRAADDVPRWGRTREDEEPRDTGAIGDEEAAVYAQPEEPWGELADISAGDLTEGTEGEVLEATALGRSRRPSARRRGAGRGRYTRLLETGDIEDLRKAVVLREVLDRPVGFRDDVGPDW